MKAAVLTSTNEAFEVLFVKDTQVQTGDRMMFQTNAAVQSVGLRCTINAKYISETCS